MATLRPARPGQELLQLGGLGQREGHQHARRDRAGPGVVLLDERGQRLLVGIVGHVLEQEDVATERLAVADGEELHGRLLAGARIAQHVEHALGEAGHLLALHRPLDGPDLVAQRRRALELERLGGGLHVLGQRPLTCSWWPSRKSITCSMSAA